MTGILTSWPVEIGVANLGSPPNPSSLNGFRVGGVRVGSGSRVPYANFAKPWEVLWEEPLE